MSASGAFNNKEDSKNISQSKLVFTLHLDAMAPLKNIFRLRYFRFKWLFRTLKTASRIECNFVSKVSVINSCTHLLENLLL